MAKILLIEDDDDQILLYNTVFKINDFDIISAISGKIGLERARNEHPDLILLDLNMEEMSGEEVIKKLGGKEAVAKTLRGYKNGAFRTYEMRRVDQWNYTDVINHPMLGGFVNGKNGLFGASESAEEARRWSNDRGITCSDCGNVMKRTAPNCYECGNCYTKVGGCGL